MPRKMCGSLTVSMYLIRNPLFVDSTASVFLISDNATCSHPEITRNMSET